MFVASNLWRLNYLISRFPIRWGTPISSQVMDDHFSIETTVCFGIPHFKKPPFPVKAITILNCLFYIPFYE